MSSALSTALPQGKRFYLFGYPVAHSVAPALHNHCFRSWGLDESNTYETWPTSKVTEDVLAAMSRDDFGGSAVTMPLKAAILPYLDEISPESRATGACNTIIKVPTATGFKFVGQNTDILGVRNALVRTLRLQFPQLNISSEASYPSSVKSAGMVIGGGATTRSAAHALYLLGLSPIFLINRDVEEIREVQESLSHLKDTLIHLRHPDDVERELVQPNSPKLLMAVGAIPSFAPITYEERLVYTTASAVFTLPYNKPTEDSQDLPIPNKRIFLEMAYKPRITPMLKVAAAHGWDAVNGVQAMIEQGLAQQRMWYAHTPTVQVGSDSGILGPRVDLSAREVAENAPDIVLAGAEVDRASGKESAAVPKKR